MYLFAPARNRPRDQRGIGSTSMVIPVALIFVGRPVIHSTSPRTPKMLPTVNSPFTCSKSLEFSQPITSPVDLANPAFSAAYNPWFAWLNQQLTSRSYLRIISTVPSVDPSSTTMYSRFGYPWLTIDRIVASRYSSPLYTAVTSVIFGQTAVFGFRSTSSRSNSARVAGARCAGEYTSLSEEIAPFEGVMAGRPPFFLVVSFSS